MDPFANNGNFWSNLTNFGMATMAAANQRDGNGFLTYGNGPLGAIGAGGMQATQQARQNDLANQQLQQMAAQTQGIQNQNALFPLQMQRMQAEMGLLNNINDRMAKPSPAAGQPWTSSAGNAPLSVQNNNPGNMRPVGSKTGFQQFNTPEDGMNAMKNDLLGKIMGNSPAMQGKRPTLFNVISTWAPASDNNDPQAYTDFVSKQTGIQPTQMLKPGDLDKVMPAMIQYEGGNQAAATFANPDEAEKNAEAVGLGYSFLNPALGGKIYENLTAGQKAQAEAAAKGEQERKTAAFTKALDVATAGPKKEAEETGTNAATASKTLNVVVSNLPVALRRFQELRAAAPDTSYGFGVEGKEGEPGWKQTLAYQLSSVSPDEAKTANANNIFQQKTAQGVLPELGPALAQAGIKGNKFLETLANEASGIDMRADPQSKIKAIDGLEEQYIQNLKSTAAQVRRYGGQAPTNDEIDAMVKDLKGSQPQGETSQAEYKNPRQIGLAYKQGKISRQQALELLNKNHGLPLAEASNANR